MQFFNSRRINIEVVLKLTILLGFALFFYEIIQSGDVYLYVHPRIVPYIKFGIAAMVLIAAAISSDLFKPRRRKLNLLPYILLIIPLFMAFALPAKTMDSTSMSINDLKSSNNINNSLENYNNTDIAAASNYKNPNDKENTQFSKSKKTELQDDAIIVSDNTFIPWIEEIYHDIAKYEGKKIKIIGFVYKDKEFNASQFVAARYSMSCCTADAQAVGLMCSYENAKVLNDNTWLKVSGTVCKINFKGEVMPAINVDTVETVVKPSNEYVYPY